MAERRAEQLHPDARAYAERITRSRRPSVDRLSPDEARREYRDAQPFVAPDQAADAPSHFENAEGFVLTRELVLHFRRQYIDPADHGDWRASPLRVPDLSRLPPATVMTAGFDPLRDEAIAYADRLRQAGVPTEHVLYADMIHGFVRLGRVIPDAQRAVERACAALRAAFTAG